MERIIELRWTCSSCGSRDILGRHKECPSCGSPREKGEMQMDGLSEDADGDGYNDNKTVTDPVLLNLANAGYDWFCLACFAGNTGTASACSGCGAPRSGDARERQAGDPARLEGSTCEHCRRAMVLPGRDCPSCGRSMEASKASPKAPPKAPPKRAPPPPRETLDDEDEGYRPQSSGLMARIGIAAISIGLLVLIGIAISWSMRTHVVIGEVQDMTWSRTIHVEAWTPTTYRDWSDQVTLRPQIEPSNGEGERAGYALVEGSCGQEFFKTEKYACGTDTETYDCSTYHSETERYSDTCYKESTERYSCGETCSSSGNGFAKCRPKTCTRTNRSSYSCTKTRTKRVRDPKTCDRQVTRYCTRPIYKERCEYETQQWVKARAPSLSGHGKDMVWPDAGVGPLERSRREEKYTIRWGYADRDRRDHFEKVVSEQQYVKWDLRQPTYIKLNNLGMVEEFSPNPFPE